MSQAILGFYSLKGIDTEFLYYLLSSMEETVKSIGQTGTQSNLSKGIVEEFVLCIPPTIKEQEIIANILSDMDEEIAALEAKRAKYEQVKRGMMQELLTGKIRLER